MRLTRKFALIPIAAAVMALGIASPAAAATANYSFGDLLSGQTGPDDSSTWASLSVETLTPLSYKFTLTLETTTFTSLFGSTAAVFGAVFNTSSGMSPISASIAGSGNGVSTVKLKDGGADLSLGFDFFDCFGAGTGCSHGGANGALVAGEKVSWTTTFASTQGDPLNFGIPPIGLHVTRINGGDDTSSAWYGVTTPVPEPETYAMLLAGLGLMGFVARRRSQRKVF